jgi:hypothetical protein
VWFGSSQVWLIFKFTYSLLGRKSVASPARKGGQRCYSFDAPTFSG